MRNFQDTLEIRERSFISTFSSCMTVPLRKKKKAVLSWIHEKLVARFHDATLYDKDLSR